MNLSRKDLTPPSPRIERATSQSSTEAEKATVESGRGHSNRPILLDLFCGAGGCTKGYQRAGFDVWGVDLHRQRNYCGDHFQQADALQVLHEVAVGAWWTKPIAAIHASPPCQRHSQMSNCRPGLADEYPDLIDPVRRLLKQTGLPWVIENVPGAPLRADLTLCGGMFGLELYRHRLFEVSFPVIEPAHPHHTTPASRAGHWKPGTIMSVSGHVAPVAVARAAMGIDWTNREELAEAVPPAYTEYVGGHLMAALQQEALAA